MTALSATSYKRIGTRSLTSAGITWKLDESVAIGKIVHTHPTRHDVPLFLDLLQRNQFAVIAAGTMFRSLLPGLGLERFEFQNGQVRHWRGRAS